MNGCKEPTDVGGNSRSSAWMFAEAILGNRILRTAGDLACSHHAVLKWCATISPVANDTLRALEHAEAERRRVRAAMEYSKNSGLLVTEWNEADHPRAPKGTSIGGQWISKGGGGGTATGRSSSSTSSDASEDEERDPHMLELAHAWWQTKSALEHARQNIEDLPKRIERNRSQLNTRYGYIYKQNLAQNHQDLETAKSLLPQLEAQLRDLEQAYHDAGYDEIPYSTFTPGETLVGGRGIEEVGRAVAMGGPVRGLQSTGIEFEIASAALAGPALLRLGKAALGGALRKATSKAAGTVDDFVAKLPRKPTPTKSPANQFEIKHTGPNNYKISGGGESFEIDGYRGTTILEAKHVGKPAASPYIPGTTCPEPVRSKILADTVDELRRIKAIFQSGTTPFKSLEIITHSPEAKSFFEKLLKEWGIPGIVRLER